MRLKELSRAFRLKVPFCERQPWWGVHAGSAGVGRGRDLPTTSVKQTRDSSA